MSASDSEATDSFLLTRFQRADWVAIVGMAAALLAAVWFVVDLKINASTAELKAEFIVLSNDFDDATTKQIERINKLDEELSGQFDSFADSIQDTVDRGLDARTDALREALAARFDEPTRLTINLANVSRSNSEATTLISNFAITKAAFLRISNYADKSVVSLTVDDFHGVEAQSVQELLDALKAADRDIVTRLSWGEGRAGFE